MLIDYHSHILPGIDDGSKSVEESLKMLHELKKQGVDKVYLTPHFYAMQNSIDDFLERRQASYESLLAVLDDDCPELVLGAEVYYFEGISRSVELSKLTCPDGNLLMLEMPFSKWTSRMVDDIYTLATRSDFQLVMAHIDRYLRWIDPRDIAEIAYRGAKIQVNCDLFLGHNRRTGIKMLTNSLVDCLGTDCHNMADRCPNMKEAQKYIMRKTGMGFTE